MAQPCSLLPHRMPCLQPVCTACPRSLCCCTQGCEACIVLLHCMVGNYCTCLSVCERGSPGAARRGARRGGALRGAARWGATRWSRSGLCVCCACCVLPNVDSVNPRCNTYSHCTRQMRARGAAPAASSHVASRRQLLLPALSGSLNLVAAAPGTLSLLRPAVLARLRRIRSGPVRAGVFSSVHIAYATPR